jgi:hypothetical protein
MLHHKAQCLIICPYCLSEATLVNPYIGQAINAADCGNDVAGHLKTNQGLGQGSVGCLQVSTRPVCKPQERSWDGAPEMISLR